MLSSVLYMAASQIRLTNWMVAMKCVVFQSPSEKSEFNVECFFQKLKWFRRIATRYDTLDPSFLSFVYLASIMILLK